MDRWLLVGALWAEVAPVVAALGDRRWLGPRLISGRLAGAEVALLRCGVGPARAAAHTRAALEAWRADRVLSFGTCGALCPSLPVGAVLTSALVGDEAGRTWSIEPLSGQPRADVATVRRVVHTATARDALLRRGFGACEMELAGVAEAAQGRPVHALKVVSDLAGADADPALPIAGLPSPARLLRFQVRAARLTRTRLLPALLTCLTRQDGPA